MENTMINSPHGNAKDKRDVHTVRRCFPCFATVAAVVAAAAAAVVVGGGGGGGGGVGGGVVGGVVVAAAVAAVAVVVVVVFVVVAGGGVAGGVAPTKTNIVAVTKNRTHIFLAFFVGTDPTSTTST